MTYALRTTLILGAFWLVVILIVAYQVHFRMAAKENKLSALEKETTEELELNKSLAANITAIQEELDLLETRWKSRKKAIPINESSHKTYEYLDRIISKKHSSMNFDYAVMNERDSSEIHLVEYSISGEARFLDLYYFLWNLEHLPRYIRINSIELTETLEETEEVNPDKRWVRFQIALTSMSANRQGFSEVETAAMVNPPVSPYDPFTLPASDKPKIPPNDRGLVNVYQSSLRALTPTQAFILDQNKELQILSLRSEVYLGTLIDIIPDENRVVFNLNQLVPPEQVSLTIKTSK